MEIRTFYAIYDVDRKLFKGRGNISGARWTDVPTQTYDTEGRANGALKAHIKAWTSHNKVHTKNLVVLPVTVTW